MMNKYFSVFLLALLPTYAHACFDQMGNLVPQTTFDSQDPTFFGDLTALEAAPQIDQSGLQDLSSRALEDGLSSRVVCSVIQRVMEIRAQFSSNDDVELTGFSLDVANLGGRTVTLNFEFHGTGD